MLITLDLFFLVFGSSVPNPLSELATISAVAYFFILPRFLGNANEQPKFIFYVRFSCVCVATLLLALSFNMQAWAENLQPKFTPVQAQLVQPRGGWGNFVSKLRSGETVKVAYLGGSITAAPGWRVKTREWLSKEFPQAKVAEINAAIGGTGSDLGVFRLQRDALQHHPDLLFVEFAVNDGVLHRKLSGVPWKGSCDKPGVQIRGPIFALFIRIVSAMKKNCRKEFVHKRHPPWKC